MSAMDAEPRQGASPMDVEGDDVCWICLDDSQDEAHGPLLAPCRCPRKAHGKCLARWQLQQAGRPEETQCRFCSSTLADWKASLTPEALKPEVQHVQPIMVVYFEGEIHRIPVKQGNDGLHEFTARIRELFRLPEDVDISLTFGCKEPMSGQHLKLEGIGAFDAAVHCASVAAAERQHKIRVTGVTGSSGGSSSSGGGYSSGGSGSPHASAGGSSGQHPQAVFTQAAAAAHPATPPLTAPGRADGYPGSGHAPAAAVNIPQLLYTPGSAAAAAANAAAQYGAASGLTPRAHATYLGSNSTLPALPAHHSAAIASHALQAAGGCMPPLPRRVAQPAPAPAGVPQVPGGHQLRPVTTQPTSRGLPHSLPQSGSFGRSPPSQTISPAHSPLHGLTQPSSGGGANMMTYFAPPRRIPPALPRVLESSNTRDFPGPVPRRSQSFSGLATQDAMPGGCDMSLVSPPSSPPSAQLGTRPATPAPAPTTSAAAAGAMPPPSAAGPGAQGPYLTPAQLRESLQQSLQAQLQHLIHGGEGGSNGMRVGPQLPTHQHLYQPQAPGRLSAHQLHQQPGYLEGMCLQQLGPVASTSGQAPTRTSVPTLPMVSLPPVSTGGAPLQHQQHTRRTSQVAQAVSGTGIDPALLHSLLQASEQAVAAAGVGQHQLQPGMLMGPGHYLPAGVTGHPQALTQEMLLGLTHSAPVWCPPTHAAAVAAAGYLQGRVVPGPHLPYLAAGNVEGMAGLAASNPSVAASLGSAAPSPPVSAGGAPLYGEQGGAPVPAPGVGLGRPASRRLRRTSSRNEAALLPAQQQQQVAAPIMMAVDGVLPPSATPFAAPGTPPAAGDAFMNHTSGCSSPVSGSLPVGTTTTGMEGVTAPAAGLMATTHLPAVTLPDSHMTSSSSSGSAGSGPHSSSSLTGRLRCSIARFSRKVARSLNFSPNSSYAAAGSIHLGNGGAGGMYAPALPADSCSPAGLSTGGGHPLAAASLLAVTNSGALHTFTAGAGAVADQGMGQQRHALRK